MHLYKHTASAVLNREDRIFFMPLFPGKHLCFSVKKTTVEIPLKTKSRENYLFQAYSSVCLDSCSLVNPAGTLSGDRWPRGQLGTCPHLPTIAGGPPSNVQTHLWLGTGSFWVLTWHLCQNCKSYPTKKPLELLRSRDPKSRCHLTNKTPAPHCQSALWASV